MRTEHRMDEVETHLDTAVVQVSTLEENDGDDRGWVTLRILSGGTALDVLLDPEQAMDVAVALQRHAGRA